MQREKWDIRSLRYPPERFKWCFDRGEYLVNYDLICETLPSTSMWAAPLVRHDVRTGMAAFDSAHQAGTGRIVSKLLFMTKYCS